MPECPHLWIAIAPQQVECFNCGARRATPYVHMQSGDIVRPIPTTTIHGEPIEWQPITETETHD